MKNEMFEIKKRRLEILLKVVLYLCLFLFGYLFFFDVITDVIMPLLDFFAESEVSFPYISFELLFVIIFMYLAIKLCHHGSVWAGIIGIITGGMMILEGLDSFELWRSDVLSIWLGVIGPIVLGVLLIVSSFLYLKDYLVSLFLHLKEHQKDKLIR